MQSGELTVTLSGTSTLFLEAHLAPDTTRVFQRGRCSWDSPSQCGEETGRQSDLPLSVSPSIHSSIHPPCPAHLGPIGDPRTRPLNRLTIWLQTVSQPQGLHVSSLASISPSVKLAWTGQS